MYNIQNKTIMITGAAGGLGYKYAEVLLRNDAKSCCGRPANIERSECGGYFGKDRAIFVSCDVTKADDLEKIFRKIIDAFKGLIRDFMLAFDYMGKHKGGKGGVIVNVASILGLHPIHALPIYCASKYAVLGFSQSLANMYDKTGMRVVIMCPGVTATPLITNISDNICDSVCAVLGSDVNLNYQEQTVDNVSLAMLHLIQKGKNGVTSANL